MARIYTTSAFFRNVPNTVLERYLLEQQLLLDFDFKSLKKTKTEPLFIAWLGLDPDVRQPHEAIFQQIFDLSCPRGIQAIVDAPSISNTPTNLSGYLAGKVNHYDKAFSTYLDFPDYWQRALQLFHADTLSSWRKRKNMPQVNANYSQKALDRLAELIGGYFHHKEGRGKNCFVEALRRNNLDYFFAYPEDYSQHSPEWVGNRFSARPHNPAFEIIYQYNQSAGTLDLHYKGHRKSVQPLQIFFAEAILGKDELEPDKKSDLVYDLGPLLSSDAFIYSASSGITDVVVKSLRLASKIQNGDVITLQADYSLDRNAVYTLLDKLTGAINLSDYKVTRAEIVATIALTADTPPQNITFAVTCPNLCTLKFEAEHLILRDMLEASGIEPNNPELPF